MRPVIGITTGAKKRGDRLDALVGCGQYYVDSILEAGGTPLLIPLSNDLRHAIEITQICQGILLTGGEDVDPSFYGEEKHEKLETVDYQRDAFELAVIRAAEEKDLPILAICRGAQILNVAHGGSLYQDIASQIEGAQKHPSSGNLGESFAAETHLVQLEADSKLSEIFDKTEIMTNSLHHQSVKKIAPGFRVTARSTDGVIEGFESLENPFCVAVQFHPEAMWQTTNRAFIKLFEAFIQSI